MKIAILTANLGNFDTPTDPVKQFLPVNSSDLVGKELPVITFHRFTDEDFPPITGLTPRFQYRIPKLFGWEMFPDYDIYVWLDGTFSFTREDCLKWFLDQLGPADAAFFKHPQRNSIESEVNYIEEKLKQNNKYLVPRYHNGLHKEQLKVIKNTLDYKDDHLFTSTAFIYRNNEKMKEIMIKWWYYQSRYYTCDQVSLPFAMYKTGAMINIINENQYKIPYLTEVSKHK